MSGDKMYIKIGLIEIIVNETDTAEEIAEKIKCALSAILEKRSAAVIKKL